MLDLLPREIIRLIATELMVGRVMFRLNRRLHKILSDQIYTVSMSLESCKSPNKCFIDVLGDTHHIYKRLSYDTYLNGTFHGEYRLETEEMIVVRMYERGMITGSSVYYNLVKTFPTSRKIFTARMWDVTPYDGERRLMKTTDYRHGKKHGYKHTYQFDGSLSCVTTYRHGKKHGYEVYLDDGKASIITHYKHGLIHSQHCFGEGRLFITFFRPTPDKKSQWRRRKLKYKHGVLRYEKIYDDRGRRHGYHAFFWPDGTIKEHVGYRHGKKQHIRRMYDQHGRLLFRQKYEDGIQLCQYPNFIS